MGAPSPPQTCLEDFVTPIRVAVNFSLDPAGPRDAPSLVLNPEITSGWTEVGARGPAPTLGRDVGPGGGR